MSHKIATADDYTDLLLELDAFLTEQGHAWGLAYSGTGDGRLVDYLGTAASVVETITATASSATEFGVSGTVSGSLGTATVGTPFTSDVVAFTIEAGDTAFEAGDEFALNMSPKWTRVRLGGCIEALYRTASFSDVANLFDGNTGTRITTTTFPATVTVQMVVATEVLAFHITGYTNGQGPAAFGLQYSDNGTDWTTAQSWSGQTWPSNEQRRDYVLTSAPGAHLYWRLNITAGQTSTLTMSEFRLYADAGMKWDVTVRAEFAWKAPGKDGTKEIYVAGYTATDNAGDRYNLVFRGFRYWIDPDLSVLNVPNNTGDKCMLLNKTPVAYWLTVNGDRFTLATRLSGRYQWAYAGFGLPYETPTEHPFPYILAAAQESSAARWNDTTVTWYSNPDMPASSNNGDVNGTMACIYPDGRIVQVVNTYSGSTSGSADGASGRAKLWPTSGNSQGTAYPTHWREAIDGTRPLIPLVIFDPATPVHVWGELEGAFFVPSFDASAEALVRRGQIDHVLLPNITRTTAFAALALD